MTHEQSASEFYESLTGYDELAIEKAFGALITDWAPETEEGRGGDPMRFSRALIFVAERRAGKTDAQAKDAAMGMTVKDTLAYFADEVEELDPDDPDTDAGKDDSEPPASLSSLPVGA